MAREHFSWGTAGKGTAGVDYGSTRDWSEQQWQDYERRNGITSTPQPAAAAGAPTGPTATSVGEQAQNAQTYSATPGAAPTQTTTNQGTVDVVRNSYLGQATQSTQIDRNDPNIKQQVDPFAASQERARRQRESEAAERLSASGMGSSGAMEQERRLASERAGQATGLFEAQLVGRELQNRRAEIQAALAQLRGIISDDQTRALQQQLADLDAQLRREGYSTQSRLGEMDTATRLQLGLLANQDAINNTALRYAMAEYGANRDGALY